MTRTSRAHPQTSSLAWISRGCHGSSLAWEACRGQAGYWPCCGPPLPVRTRTQDRGWDRVFSRGWAVVPALSVQPPSSPPPLFPTAANEPVPSACGDHPSPGRDECGREPHDVCWTRSKHENWPLDPGESLSAGCRASLHAAWRVQIEMKTCGAGFWSLMCLASPLH